MSSFVPPPPIIIGGGGGGDGSSINTSDSSIILTSDEINGTSTATISTSNLPAIVVDSDQNVLVGAGSTTSTSRLVVATPGSNCLELINTPNSESATFSVSSTGSLSINASGDDINLTGNSVKLDNNSLYLNGTQVLTTADELNYLKITKGTATANKALVLNASSNISGINSLSATSLTGVLQTGSQPNITSLATINITTALSLGGILVSSTAAELNYLHVTPGLTVANKALIVDSDKSISGINLLSATTLGGTLQTAAQPNITSIGTLSTLKISGRLGVGTTNPDTDIEVYSVSNPVFKLNNGTNSSNIAIDSSGNLRLNSDGNIMVQSGHSLVLGGSGVISGALRVSATYLNGTLETASQTNITAIGTLTNLLVSNSIGLGTVSPNKKMEIFDSSGDCLRISRTITEYADLTINASGDLIVSPVGTFRLSTGTSLRLSSGNITGVDSITATNITGTLQTASQPNITTIGTLSNLTVSEEISCDSLVSNIIAGTIQTPSQPNITAIGTLSNLSVTNGISCSSVAATSLTGILQTSNQLNITTVGTLTRLAVVNDITGDSLTATTITGTLQTAAQPNITSIGTLSNLNVNNTLTVSTVSATTLSGTIQTASQPNITTIGTLGSLSVTNGISSSSLTATDITGTLQTASQPNITTIGTLGSLSVTNGISSGSLTATNITGTLQTYNQPNIRSVGVLSSVLTSGKIGINVAEPVYDIDIASADGNAISIGYNENLVSISASSSGDLVITTDSKRLVLDNNTSLRFNGTGGISGLASFSATEITGTLQTAAQPNITSLGMLEYIESGSIRLGDTHTSIYAISVNYPSGRLLSLSNGTFSITHQIIDGEYVINSSTGRIALATNVDFVLNGGNIIGLTELTVGNFTVSGEQLALLANVSTGTVVADSLLAADSNLDLVGFSNLGATTLSLGNSTLHEAQLALLANVSTGTVVADSLLAADSNLDLVGFNQLSATTLAGTLQTASQPNITSLGTLSGLSINGSVGIDTNTPQKRLEINSATGNCLRLSYDKNTSEANYVDMTVSAAGNLSIVSSGGSTTIDQVVSNKLILGNTSNSIMPLEIGYVPFVMTGAYAYNTSGGARGVMTAGGTTSYNYSIRAQGRILCTQSVDVTSDRRVKTNIQELSEEYCTKFIEKTTPVSFNLINGDSSLSYGYIAQDLLRHGFDDLVNLNHDAAMEEEIDEDGLISPKGVKFSVSYEHIIPMLAINQRRLMQENAELKQTVAKLLEIVQELMK